MTRWAIPLDRHRKQRLPHDAFELGDLITDDDGGELLLFRDRFVALKVASRVGDTTPIAFTPSAPAPL